MVRARTVLARLRRILRRTVRIAHDHLNARRQVFSARFRDRTQRMYHRLRPNDALLWQLRLGLWKIAVLVTKLHCRPYGPSHRYFISAPIQTDRAIGNHPEQELPVFDPAENPVVSIVIPVYNKIDFTLGCLWSVHRQPWSSSYEVIVVDDCSTDQTHRRLTQVSGLRLVTNVRNLGFVRSCNAGARQARGEYLLFLNNDTEVLPGWMDELVETFELRADAGLVGSMLLYPDGRLQEAGGFVSQEGSGGNYGRNDDPNKPQYNFLRETDYCSGASVMVPRALFETLGNFDERYAPAYYEDTDLAFTVRKAGHKVYYQPLSRVVHHEGVSSGTDLRKGVKAYQVENKQKFYERWHDDLAGHGWPGTDHRREAERYVGKRVLVINMSALALDMMAELATARHIAQIFQSRSYQVSFALCPDLSYVEETVPALQRTGVECLYAPFVTSLARHLRQRGSYYDAVFQYRANFTQAFLDKTMLLRLCPKAQLLTHTGDGSSLQQQGSNILKGLETG